MESNLTKILKILSDYKSEEWHPIGTYLVSYKISDKTKIDIGRSGGKRIFITFDYGTPPKYYIFFDKDMSNISYYGKHGSMRKEIWFAEMTEIDPAAIELALWAVVFPNV